MSLCEINLCNKMEDPWTISRRYQTTTDLQEYQFDGYKVMLNQP